MYEMMRNEILMSELTSSVSNSMNEYILTIFHTALIFSLFRFFCIKTKEMKDNNILIQSDTVIEKVTENSVTVSARGTIGYAEIRKEIFFPIIRLIVLIPDEKNIKLDLLKYALDNINFTNSGVAIPQLTVPMIRDYKIGTTRF